MQLAWFTLTFVHIEPHFIRRTGLNPVCMAVMDDAAAPSVLGATSSLLWYAMGRTDRLAYNTKRHPILHFVPSLL